MSHPGDWRNTLAAAPATPPRCQHISTSIGPIVVRRSAGESVQVAALRIDAAFHRPLSLCFIGGGMVGS